MSRLAETVVTPIHLKTMLWPTCHNYILILKSRINLNKKWNSKQIEINQKNVQKNCNWKVPTYMNKLQKPYRQPTECYVASKTRPFN